MKVTPWTDDELSQLRTLYIQGLTDREIGKELDRSATAVEAKRTELRLIQKLYPERPRHPRKTVGRLYSKQDEADILSRWNSGEAATTIADDYGVSPRALVNKVERMFDRVHVVIPEKTGRRCLWCNSWFLSSEPKSVRRKCDTCREGADAASVLTLYPVHI